MWFRRLVHLRDRWQRNPVSHWCLLFVILAMTVRNFSGPNPTSRHALLMAVVEDHSLALGDYWGLTCDWSRTPDGRYFSNKAPGPALLALPLFAPIDAWVVYPAKDRKARDARRLEAREDVLLYLSMALQVIPFALLVMLSAEMLAARGVSRVAIELAALAMLFGNTASLLMNTFFGHGMAAVLALALALALLERRIVLVGLLFALGVLSDYGSALFFPFVWALVVLPGWRGVRGVLSRSLRFFAGGLGPLVVFVAYHMLCFGGPLTLPNKFQNPVFVEAGRRALWGVIDFLPDKHVAYELAFGLKRGLAVTQPWVFVLAAVLLLFAWSRRRWSKERLAAARIVVPFAFGGLLVLFLMNAAFGGWHGGVSPGPRYLSAILPVLGLALGLSYDSFARPVRLLLWLAVVPALVLFLIVWAGNVNVWPGDDIWHCCWWALAKAANVTTYVRLSWMGLAFFVTAVIAILRAWLDHPVHKF
jgi:hypothetical protein